MAAAEKPNRVATSEKPCEKIIFITITECFFFLYTALRNFVITWLISTGYLSVKILCISFVT